MQCASERHLTTGFITFVNDTDPIKDITVNIVRLELSVNAEEGGE